MYYEVIYETGDKSVACYDSDEEALAAVTAANERAASGGRSLNSEPGSPPAARVARVLKYDRHPDDYDPTSGLSADVAAKQVGDLIKAAADENGVVDTMLLSGLVRDMNSPLAVTESPHDSMFKLEEVEELALPWKGDK